MVVLEPRDFTQRTEYLTKFDKELLALTFETWKDNVRDRVLVFVDEDYNFYFMPYQT